MISVYKEAGGYQVNTDDRIRLYLCKPNRETITELPETYGKSVVFNYGGIHELNFKLPYTYFQKMKYVKNPHVNQLRGHYLIRYEKDSEVMYFTIAKPKRTFNDGKEELSVQCYLLPYQLRGKIVRSYSGTKKLYDPLGVDGVLNDTLLKKSDWKIGYIDQDIARKYRTFDVSQKKLLDFINDLAETFDAVVTWDTENKKINFYKDSALGQDKGLLIEYGKYLKAINEEPDFDNVYTRLYPYGRDGLNIARVNNSGMDFIDNYGYYMHPFKRENGVVIESSNYMSDELCIALENHAALTESKAGEFEGLFNQKTTLNNSLLTKENELIALQDQFNIILDNLDIAQANGLSTISQLITDRNNKQIEIDVKQSEIDTIKVEISNVDSNLLALKNETSMENNFSDEELIELNEYINEYVWEDNNYFDEKELFTDAKDKLNKICQPLVSYEIDIVDFLTVASCEKDWSKLSLGDVVTIRYPNFGVDIKAKIITIERSIDDNSIKLTIANSKDIKSGFLLMKDLIKKSVSSATTLDMSKIKWDENQKTTSKINDIINNTWSALDRQIKAGVNESVDISRRGIIIKSPDNPNKQVILQSGVVALTSDNGQRWRTAITPDYIVGEQIAGKLLLGTNLIVDASDEQGIKTFTVDGQGVKIRGASLTIEQGLPESQINSTSTTKWNSAEQNAKNYADEQITEVNTSLSNLQTDIDDMSSDSKITLAEANSLKNSLQQLIAESEDLKNVGWSLGATTEVGNYNVALGALATELDRWLNKIYPLDIGSSGTSREVIQSKFDDVQDTKSKLVNKIMEIREANATSVANAAQDAAEQAQTDASTANNTLDDIASDSKLTPSEKLLVKKEWDVIVGVKPIIDAQSATYGFSNSTEQTNYTNAYNTLNTYLNNVSTGLLLNLTTTSDIIGSTFRSNFKSYYDAKVTLLKKIAEQAKTLADNAQAKADSSVQQGTAYNGVKIDTTNGLVVTKNDNKVKTTVNATQGIKIQYSSDGTNWIDRFYVDAATGKLMAEELQTNKIIIKNGNDVLIDASTRTIDFTKFTTKTGKLTADNIDGTNLTVQSASVASSITAGGIDGETITGATIRTSSNPNRVVMDSTGLHAYHLGVERVSIASTADQQTRAIYLRNSSGAIQGLIAHGSEFAGTGVYIAGNAQAGANAGYILIKDDGSVWAGNNGSSYRLDQTPNATAKFG